MAKIFQATITATVRGNEKEGCIDWAREQLKEAASVVETDDMVMVLNDEQFREICEVAFDCYENQKLGYPQTVIVTEALLILRHKKPFVDRALLESIWGHVESIVNEIQDGASWEDVL